MKKPFRNKVTTRSKTVLINEFKNIVGEANIRRLILFDAVNSETTLTDRSNNKQNATLSLSANSLDQSISGKAKILNFNASGDFWEFADADDLSFGNGTADSAFSIVACVNPNTLAGDICAKYDITTGATEKEFSFNAFNNRLYLALHDNSANSQATRYTSAIAADIGTWKSYIATYNGTPLTGQKIYRNGTQADNATYTTGTYTAMENKSSKVGNYYLDTSGAKTSIGSFKYAFLAIVSIELSQGQVTSIDSLLRKYAGII